MDQNGLHVMDPDEHLINEIAPDVLKVLAGKRFFEALYDEVCPVNPEQPPLLCDGTYAISTAVLTALGCPENDIADITQVLGSRGGSCDCEILFNVAEDSRLKSRYWKARAAGGTPPDSHTHHVGG
jgi:hypothetical protein